MKVVYELTENQKFRLLYLVNSKDEIMSKLQKAYYAERTNENFEYINALNRNLMVISAEMGEIYASAPVRCMLTEEDCKNIKSSLVENVQYREVILNEDMHPVRS